MIIVKTNVTHFIELLQTQCLSDPVRLRVSLLPVRLLPTQTYTTHTNRHTPYILSYEHHAHIYKPLITNLLRSTR